MSTVRRYFVRGVIALPVGAVAMLWSGNVPLRDPTAWVSTATARLGAPATPLSVGGVARRTTRGGVVAGAPGVAPPELRLPGRDSVSEVSAAPERRVAGRAPTGPELVANA